MAPSKKNIVVEATVARRQTVISRDVWSINITKCESSEVQREQIFGCIVCCELVKPMLVTCFLSRPPHEASDQACGRKQKDKGFCDLGESANLMYSKAFAFI